MIVAIYAVLLVLALGSLMCSTEYGATPWTAFGRAVIRYELRVRARAVVLLKQGFNKYDARRRAEIELQQEADRHGHL